VFDAFLTERKYLKGVSPKTIIAYETAFKAFSGCESREQIIERIKELRERGVSATSVNCYLRHLNAYLKWKEAGFKIPKLKEEQKLLPVLSADMVGRILKFSPRGVNATRAHLIALVILDTGLRISEVLGLTKEDVDFDQLTLRVLGKGGKHRVVPFSPDLRKHLFRFSNRTNRMPNNILATRYLFGTKNNTKLTVRNFHRDLQKLGKQIGITFKGPHALRHSFAVLFLSNGGDLFQLSRILGHSDIRVTAVYLRSLGMDALQETHRRVSPLSRLR